MDFNVSFIGCGYMASAIIRGMLASGCAQPCQITASNIHAEKLKRLADELNINAARSNREAAAAGKAVVLAVTPQQYPEVAAEIAPYINEDTIVVSIAPSFTTAELTKLFGRKVKLVRAMPNTPVMVGEGMTALCRNALVTDSEFDSICGIFAGFGRAEAVAEELMDTAAAVSGSSPACVFMFIEALADAAVLGGMPRDTAYRFAAQAVCGSAKMVLKTGLHPGALKDMVCSPGGTTIEAVAALESGGFRGCVTEAMRRCMSKTQRLKSQD